MDDLCVMLPGAAGQVTLWISFSLQNFMNLVLWTLG